MSEVTEVVVADPIPHWRVEINALDDQIVACLAARMVVSLQIQQTRLQAGGNRVAMDREREVFTRYTDVLGGHYGTRLAALILDMCRGSVWRAE